MVVAKVSLTLPALRSITHTHRFHSVSVVSQSGSEYFYPFSLALQLQRWITQQCKCKICTSAVCLFALLRTKQWNESGSSGADGERVKESVGCVHLHKTVSKAAAAVYVCSVCSAVHIEHRKLL